MDPVLTVCGVWLDIRRTYKSTLYIYQPRDIFDYRASFGNKQVMPYIFLSDNYNFSPKFRHKLLLVQIFIEFFYMCVFCALGLKKYSDILGAILHLVLFICHFFSPLTKMTDRQPNSFVCVHMRTGEIILYSYIFFLNNGFW